MGDIWGVTPGPAAIFGRYVCVYNYKGDNQQHFSYLDESGNIWDSWFDGQWRLQKINNGGTTAGPSAAGGVFVSVYN
jgi:hypothetical protein